MIKPQTTNKKCPEISNNLKIQVNIFYVELKFLFTSMKYKMKVKNRQFTDHIDTLIY